MPLRELCSKYIKERLQARTFDPQRLFLANSAVPSLVLLTKSKKFSSNVKAGVKLCLLLEIDSHLKEKKTFSRCSVLSKVCWFKIVLIIKTFVIMNGLWICGKVLTGSKLNRP